MNLLFGCLLEASDSERSFMSMPMISAWGSHHAGVPLPQPTSRIRIRTSDRAVGNRTAGLLVEPKPAKILSRFPADLDSDEHTTGGTATTAENHQHRQGACCGAGTPACYAAI